MDQGDFFEGRVDRVAGLARANCNLDQRAQQRARARDLT